MALLAERPAPASERTPRRTVGVLLAGGSGTRTGLEYPKQFLTIGGRTVLEHTLGVFQATPEIDELIVVTAPEWFATARTLVDRAGAEKASAIIAGGATRNHSTAAALAHLHAAPDHTKLLIHDAVRPLLTRAILERCVVALDECDAIDVVIDVDDTIVEVDDADRLVAIPPRSRLRRGQTPQGFALGTLRAAYAAHTEAELTRFTDDCAVVMSALPETEVRAVAGSPDNMKITRAIDITLADRLLQLQRGDVPPGVAGDGPVAPGVVAVIGGSSGIGAATVARLRELGTDAVSLSRRDGGVDVRDEASIGAALARLRANRGPVAAVVNCAGVLTRGELTALDPGAVVEQLEVNLTGSVHVARAAHELLAETGGHLVLFTSSSYTRGRAGYAVYSATKAGVVNLAQALAEEWCDAGVKVNCVNPARTATPMRSVAFGAEPDGTLLDAATVAETVAAVLASEASGHVYDVRAPSAVPAPA